MFNEAWSILKSFHSIEAWGMDTEWEELISKTGELYQIGKGSKHTEALAKSLALGVLEYLEIISKDKGDKEACIAERLRELEASGRGISK